ncbi:pirin family protein [Catenovulum sp. 2E275]|uniref:pirin family protein n=1 Tax=Catenovulum sp. 2E275 TaxID=2980497 RepID=UPI0021D17049|nr:pirin family protein [Catenovulum sp. 2E275]MCU4676951.1 pirin family protein [Catenovulum sp. 2E275]
MARKLNAKQHDLGGLTVKRILPNPECKMVGPFIFFDHIGPAQFAAGEGINVRPHPHIGLSTLTYLFDGHILHRDSLGNHIEIAPGDVNWMTAGKGIVHSERETLETRASQHTIHGLQCWIALPKNFAEIEPEFIHVKKEQLPVYMFDNVMKRLIVGDAYGMSSPVKSHSPIFYLDVVAQLGSQVFRPNLDHLAEQETAMYVIDGEVCIGDVSYKAGDFVLFESADHAIDCVTHARFILLGGDKFTQVPYIDWNFVSFDKARIEQARDDWKNGRFPTIAGDDKEFIPL